MTTGSAQAPPIQPWTSPSAVMIARLPSWPDDGPCRHTTVAIANARPWRASSLARSRTPQPSILSSLFACRRSIVRADGRRAGDVVALGDRLPDPVRQQRHVDVADPGVAYRVHHRVDERRRAADRRALTDPFGADRVVRARRDDLA